MRRVARLLLYVCTAAVVLALGKYHARYIGGYDYTGSLRFGWSFAYIGLLCLAAYGVGLPDLARRRKLALVSALGGHGRGRARHLGAAAARRLGGAAPLRRCSARRSRSCPIYLALSVVSAGGRARDEERDRVVLVGRARRGRQPARRARPASPSRRPRSSPTLGVEEARSLEVRVKPLVETVVRERASVVVLDREAQADESIVAQAATLHEHGVRIRTLSLFYDEWLGKLPLRRARAGVADVRHRRDPPARYGRIKRIVDVAVGVAGALVLARRHARSCWSATWSATAGRLLYRQPRVGRNGRVFDILKFRTMRPDRRATSDWTERARPPHHAVRAAGCAARTSTSCRRC